jgi:phage-related protein
MIATPKKRLSAAFYQTGAGNEPVREWLKDLDKEERRAIGTDIKTVEIGWPVGMPTCRPISGHDGLWEVRTAFERGIARTFFCIKGGKMVLLHGIIKKSQKTPKNDIQTAVKRMKQVLK